MRSLYPVGVLRSGVPLLLVVALLTGCQPSAGDDAPPRDLPPLRVLVAGDSLAAGYYASQAERGFAGLLVEDLADEHDVTVETVAVLGARALGVAIEVAERTAGAPPADVVVLEAGSNDVGESTLRVWTQTYRRLLDAVAVSSPEATVVCLGPWGPPAQSRPYEAVVRRLCAEHRWAPLSDLYATRGLRGPRGSSTGLGARDAFHPNDRGHARIAERLREVLAAPSAATAG